MDMRSTVLRLGTASTVCLTAVGALSGVDAQQVLDRVVARVGRDAILLSDVRAAAALGIVAPVRGEDPEASAVQQLIDRHLMLAEVARFPPPEPDPAVVDVQAAAMRAHAGAGLDALLRSTGIDERRIREMARDSVRIEAYLNQRFAATLQVTDEDVRRYYETHPGEFLRDGVPISFEDAEPAARQRAAAERRQMVIRNWIAGLRGRADVTLVPAR